MPRESCCRGETCQQVGGEGRERSRTHLDRRLELVVLHELQDELLRAVLLLGAEQPLCLGSLQEPLGVHRVLLQLCINERRERNVRAAKEGGQRGGKGGRDGRGLNRCG